MTGSITRWIGDYGLYAVFLLMLVDAVFPAASEVVMVYGGALAAGAFANSGVKLFGTEVHSTAAGFVVVATGGTIGYTIGSVAGWAIGLYGGRPFLERHGRRLHLGPDRLGRAEAWFERYGNAAVFLGRVLPIVRSFVSIPAGVLEFPLLRYTALTFAGSTLWCLALAGVGVGVGESWQRFHHDFRYADVAAVVLVAAGALWLAARALRKRRAARPA